MLRSFMSVRTLAVALVTAGLLSSAACSSDDPDEQVESEVTTTTTSNSPPEKQDFVDGFILSTTKEGVVSPDQGQCIGEAWVDLIGVSTLNDAGISPEQFGDVDPESFQKLELGSTEADALFDLLKPCGFDLVALIQPPTYSEITPAQQTCVDEIVTDEAVRSAFTSNITDGEAAHTIDELRAEAQACLDV